MQETALNINGNQVKIRFVPNGSYQQNPNNTNKGNPRGDAAIRESVGAVGWHKAITTTADGTVIAGNHAYSIAQEEGVVQGWIEIETMGDVGIVTKRIDWDNARVPDAIKAAIIDNRTQELNFDLDIEQFQNDLGWLQELGEDIGDVFYTGDEISEMFSEINDEVPDFEPVGEDEQGRLDQIEPKEIPCTCPNCGHDFIQQY